MALSDILRTSHSRSALVLERLRWSSEQQDTKHVAYCCHHVRKKRTCDGEKLTPCQTCSSPHVCPCRFGSERRCSRSQVPTGFVPQRPRHGEHTSSSSFSNVRGILACVAKSGGSDAKHSSMVEQKGMQPAVCAMEAVHGRFAAIRDFRHARLQLGTEKYLDLSIYACIGTCQECAQSPVGELKKWRSRQKGITKP